MFQEISVKGSVSIGNTVPVKLLKKVYRLEISYKVFKREYRLKISLKMFKGVN